jgi:hypothetical protein
MLRLKRCFQSSKPSTQAWPGRPAKARLVIAGVAGRGGARRGEARQAGQGWAWHGQARQARQGWARRGEARPGQARQHMVT